MSDPNEDRALELARAIVDVLDEHKGEDILLLDLNGICSFADYFVLCTGASQRTLGALAQEVLRRMKRGRRIVARGRGGAAESGRGPPALPGGGPFLFFPGPRGHHH